MNCPGSRSGFAWDPYVLYFIAGGIGACRAMAPHLGGIRMPWKLATCRAITADLWHGLRGSGVFRALL